MHLSLLDQPRPVPRGTSRATALVINADFSPKPNPERALMNLNHLAPSTPRRSGAGQSQEIVGIVVLTLAAALVRIWALGRVGLVHFDEGIYALAGLWSLSPRGLQSLDPTFIAYSPPGYPILVGLFYLLFGVSDTSAILVSIICGTATVPVVAWLSHRTFGRGAGAAAAALAAGSGAHVSFSRMALTDVSFVLAFLIVLGQGQRFLERPNLARAVVLGLSVGAAQLFKYNGWISGMIVAAATALIQLANPNARATKTRSATWCCGLCAILLASVVYWPWFQFVQTHGGYGRLLEHQRSYLSGLSRWPDHWWLQLAQQRALGGSLMWRSVVGIAAGLSFLISFKDRVASPIRWLQNAIQALGLASLCAIPNAEWWAPLGWIGFVALCCFRAASPSIFVLGVAWLALSIMTPFYHPYARLWLPLAALGWIIAGGLFVAARNWLEAPHQDSVKSPKRQLSRLFVLSLLCAIGLAISAIAQAPPAIDDRPGPLEPTGSLRAICQRIPRELPPNVTDLRLFCRPAVTFYLSSFGRANLRIQPTLDRLLEPATPSTWCLVDGAVTRHESRSAANDRALESRWTVVHTFATRVNLPTLLDIDPAACSGGAADPLVPLILLRPGRPQEVR
jgi:dolichyl-phosphate-mannose-protein mannosyltransferase